MKRRSPSLPPQVGQKPIVAVVGRPNVGKSTLFNRLVGAHLAIVENMPGVTRDRHYADTDLYGNEVTLIDTGGFDPEPGDPVTDLTRGQVRAAVDEADVLLCVFDGRTSLTSADEETVRLLRRSGKPVVFASNKVDGDRHEAEALATGYRAGVKELILVSALHGRGISELMDSIIDVLPDRAADELQDVPHGAVRVALVGRPNAGKSSLINRLVGADRMLIDDKPGTTRDAIDSLVVHNDEPFVMIDTAGIRKRRRVSQASERHAVFSAIRALSRAHIAVLMVDAKEGVAEQDAKIAGLAVDRGCAIVVGANKWDMIKGNEESKNAYEQCREVLSFIPYAPLLRISAKTGRGIDKLMKATSAIAKEHDKRVGTSELNKFFEQLVAKKPPPIKSGRPLRFYYVSQVAVRPPKFVVTCNFPKAVHFSYQRFITNQIRERFGFEGTPLRVVFKGRGKRKSEEQSFS